MLFNFIVPIFLLSLNLLEMFSEFVFLKFCFFMHVYVFVVFLILTTTLS